MYDEDDVTILPDGSEELDAGGKNPEDKLAKVKRELEHVRKEKQEYLDGWQRAKADYVNALKRFDLEKREVEAKGIAKAATAFIGVLDTLERAEAAGDIPESFKAVAKQLHGAAQSLGLTKYGTVGEIFDPSYHEALGQDNVESAKEDSLVTAVLETGWKADHSVIRPAKVRVGHFEEAKT